MIDLVSVFSAILFGPNANLVVLFASPFLALQFVCRLCFQLFLLDSTANASTHFLTIIA
jgi:hypothetical protein